MKRFSTRAWAMGGLALLMLSVQIAPGAADGWSYHHRYRQHTAGVAYVEAVPTDYGSCRTGWWQSVRYGHVRPYWGVLCR